MKWQGRTKGGSFGQRSIYGLLRRLDIRGCYVILRLVIPFYMLFAARGRKAIYRYFRTIHGYRPWKALRKTYRNHYLFGQLLFDRFAIFAGKAGRLQVSVEGNEHFQHAVESEKPCIIAGSHTGNFEILGYLLSQEHKPMHAVVYGGEAEVVQRYREKVLAGKNIHLVPVADDMSHIFEINRALSAGGIVSMPCDRVYTGNKSVEIDFLGARAKFPTGAFHLACKAGANVLAIFVMKTRPLAYKVYVRPLGSGAESDVKRLQARFAEELGSIVQQYPEQWYNFYPFWSDNKR